MARSHPIMALAASLPLLLACLPAMAAQPAGPAPATAPATPAATPQPATTAATTTTAATSKADTKPLPATRPGGYRLRNTKGVLAYCRTVTPIGTTLPKQECLTPDALDELLKHGQNQSDGMMQHMAVCGNSSAACVSN